MWFGQLVLNKGKWVDTSSGFSVTTQLIDESYIEAMISPQHPNAINNYGLLTWLSDPGAAPANCCQPQWLCTAPGSQQVRLFFSFCSCSCPCSCPCSCARRVGRCRRLHHHRGAERCSEHRRGCSAAAARSRHYGAAWALLRDGCSTRANSLSTTTERVQR